MNPLNNTMGDVNITRYDIQYIEILWITSVIF